MITQRGMEAHKVAALAALIGQDAVEEVQAMATRTEKSADDMRIAYKVWKDTVQPEAVDDGGGDEYPADLLDALESAYEQLGDWQPITAALQQLATPTAKPRVLTDSGKQSAFPTTKAYNPARDVFALAVGADQVQRGRAPVATKSAPQSLKSLIEASLNGMGDLH